MNPTNPTSFGNQPPPTPLHGAAYRVLYEATLPAFCNTRARQAEIVAAFAEVTAWAKTQTPDVQRAYKWAVDSIKRDLETRMVMVDRASMVRDAFATVPRPPSMPEKPAK